MFAGSGMFAFIETSLRFVFSDSPAWHSASRCMALTVVRQRRSHFSLLNVEEAHRTYEFHRHRVQLGRALAVYRMGRVQGSAVRRNLFLQNHPAHHQHHPAKAKRKRLQRDKKKINALSRLRYHDKKTMCTALRTFNMHEINSAEQYTRERLINLCQRRPFLAV